MRYKNESMISRNSVGKHNKLCCKYYHIKCNIYDDADFRAIIRKVGTKNPPTEHDTFRTVKSLSTTKCTETTLFATSQKYHLVFVSLFSLFITIFRCFLMFFDVLRFLKMFSIVFIVWQRKWRQKNKLYLKNYQKQFSLMLADVERTGVSSVHYFSSFFHP